MKFALLFFAAFLILVLVSGVAFAQERDRSGTGLSLSNPLGCTTFGDCAGRILDFLINVGLALAPIFILVGGFQMLTSGGDPNKFTTGRKTVTYAAVGLAVIIISKGVVSVIQSLFNG